MKNWNTDVYKESCCKEFEEWRYGLWIEKSCDECGTDVQRFNYCPYCGVKLE